MQRSRVPTVDSPAVAALVSDIREGTCMRVFEDMKLKIFGKKEDDVARL
jgi:hypothetical protein